MALVRLVDGIREDLAGKRLHPHNTAFERLILSHDTAKEGISVKPMAPFLSSLASKKTLLRKCLDDFSAKVDYISRHANSVPFSRDILMNIETPSSIALWTTRIPIASSYRQCLRYTTSVRT